MSEITKTGWDVLDEARAGLRATVAGVPGDGWQRPTPCSAWSALQVRQHAALDQGVRAAVIAGTQPSGEDPFAPSGQLGGDPLAYVQAALDASAPAWARVSGDGGPVPTPLPLPSRALTSGGKGPRRTFTGCGGCRSGRRRAGRRRAG